MKLQGKRAVVVGGSRGIGAAIALRLAEDGADTVVTYNQGAAAANRVAAEIVAAGRTGRAIAGNVGDSVAARTAIDTAATVLGGIDVLVYSAGVGSIEPFAETSTESYERQFAVNVAGLFHSVQAALPHLADGGRIILLGNINGDRVPGPGGAVYSATKSAVQGFGRGLARDLAPRGILVNVLQPGPVDTDMNPADGELAKVLTPMIALGRYGRPEEIAAVAAFLASDDASFVTGSMLTVDGGFNT